MIGFNFTWYVISTKIKNFFKSLGKAIINFPSYFLRWFKLNIIKIMVTIGILSLLLIIVSVNVYYCPRYPSLSVPSGDVFDVDVMSFFMIDNLKKPSGFTQEKFNTTIGEDAQDGKDYGIYEYDVYSSECFGEDYILYVSDFFDSLNGKKFLYGTEYPDLFPILKGNTNPTVVKTEGYVYYSTLYTDQFVKGKYVFKSVKFAVNIREITVSTNLQPNKDGLYRISIELSFYGDNIIYFKKDFNSKFFL